MVPGRLCCLPLLSLSLFGCGATSPESLPSPSTDAGATADAGTADLGSADAETLDLALADGGSEDLGGSDAADPWAAVDALLQTRSTAAGVANFGFMVFDADDHLLHVRTFGDFSADQPVAIASASKLVAGLVIFEVIARGQLSLESTTGEILGWTGPNAAITLRHLLSFTSGLEPDHRCTRDGNTTLADCVAIFGGLPLKATPGTTFEYGSSHLHVAGRMAEVVTGQRWNGLFRAILADPLGLPAEVRYYTAPRQDNLPTDPPNPLIAGGMRASMNDYAKLLQLAFHRGQTKALTIGTPQLFDEQSREPFPDVTIVASPFRAVGFAYRYGLASWLECETPATGCTTLSSPGAFGFTPWYDREQGYVAILGMQLSMVEGGVGSGVVDFSVHLAQDAKPLIEAALPAR